MPRLFFALWPDDLTRSKLAATLASLPALSGRPVPLRNLHITLVFLGDITNEQQQQLIAEAPSVQAPPFDLVLSQLGCWPQASVAWLEPEAVPPPLPDLVRQLGTVCEQAGLTPDGRPYQPHLTIARKIKRVPAANIAPIHWQIREFALIESVRDRTGSEYRPLAHWPLIRDENMG